MSEAAIFNCLYSIGHSNVPIDKFIELLKEHNIQVVVDVRSYPFSKYATHFNYDTIQPALKNASIKYLYLGKELGGMPKGQEFYDLDGNLVYARVANTKEFQEAIARLVRGARTHTIALMCGEENPAGCHRRHLLGPALKQQQLELLHIRAGGQVQSESDLENLENPVEESLQLSLFDSGSLGGA
ncbi:MAG: DUF488 domain-containing protein [Candidatus Obscuribacterales bacterium]|nr:DUF488 domain-containing protein [Cyanobacteria bacterium SZAS LIN-5]RTL44590.1 MAG: DUF488 domain-containing protein [Candidatus Melainabacteria bacterium]